MSPLADFAKRGAYSVLGSHMALRRRLAAIEKAGVAVILNLHRVAPDDGSAYKPLEPLLFERLLEFLAGRFHLVRLGELGEKSSRPKMVLSFDDGYKDFIDVAAPILHRHKISVNQNIVPRCIETQLPPFNVLAQDFIGKAPRELVAKLELPGFKLGEAPGRGLQLSIFLKERPQVEQEALAQILLPQFYAWDGFRPTPMMTRDEVRQIAGEHELGAHSFDHANMDCETDEYLEADVARCRAYFAELVGAPVSIYAFPNGRCRTNQIDILRRLGMRHILLVGEDFDRGGDVHRRFTFGAESLSEARFRALGARAAIA
jgi:peptidoglycan/xylan/chitin deacetylase (PgdA/CDA1 family)